MPRNNILTTIIPVVVIFFVSACSSSPEQTKLDYYNNALQYIENGDNSAAIIELRNAIQADAKYSDARYQLGLMYLKQGDKGAAFGELQRAANLDPQNLDANIKVAEFFLMGKKKVEARKHLDRVLSINPTYTDGLALLANMELIEGNYTAALSAVDAIPPVEAETDKICNIRGRIFASNKEFDKSEEMFLKAIDLGPEKLTNYQTLLRLYQQQKQIEKANTLLTRIMDTFPDSSQALLIQASYYNSNKDFQKTEQIFQKLIDLEPENERFRLLLSDFLITHRQHQAAEDALTSALENLPESENLTATLADLKFNMRKLDEARQLSQKVLDTNGNHRVAIFVKAKLLFAEDKPDEAIALLNQLVANDPKWAEPFYYLAVIQTKLGELELALSNIQTALKLSPAKSKYHTLQARLHLISGDAATAGKEATIALKLDPSNYIATRLVVKALLLEKRFDDTIKLALDLQKKVPNEPDLLSSLGFAYVGKKDLDNAKTTFLTILEMQPANSRALAMAASLNSAGSADKAIEFVQNHINNSSDAPSHYMLLANLFLKKKMQNEALEALDKALSLDKNNPQAYILRGQIKRSQGKTEEAISEFQLLLANDSDSVPGNLGLATLLESQGKLVEAKEKYKRILQIQPDQAVAANNLAYIITNEENGDLGEALRLAMLAKQAHPEDPRIADTLGAVHLKRGSYSLAITQFEQAINERPDDPLIGHHLALAYKGNGDKNKAIETLEKLIANDNFKNKDEISQMLSELKTEQD